MKNNKTKQNKTKQNKNTKTQTNKDNKEGTIFDDLSEPLTNYLWTTVNDVIDMNECKFYRYNPDDDVLQAIHERNIWCSHVFMLNTNQKQLLYFTLSVSNDVNSNSQQRGFFVFFNSLFFPYFIFFCSLFFCEKNESKRTQNWFFFCLFWLARRLYGCKRENTHTHTHTHMFYFQNAKTILIFLDKTS